MKFTFRSFLPDVYISLSLSTLASPRLEAIYLFLYLVFLIVVLLYRVIYRALLII